MSKNTSINDAIGSDPISKCIKYIKRSNLFPSPATRTHAKSSFEDATPADAHLSLGQEPADYGSNEANNSSIRAISFIQNITPSATHQQGTRHIAVYDVLSGQGRVVHRHPCNIKYRAWVSANKVCHIDIILVCSIG